MIGSIVLATDQGLGYLAKEFYDKGVLDKVAILPHKNRVNHYEWYKGDLLSVEELLGRVDTLLFFETPLIGEVIPECKKRGIKMVMIPMYECSNYDIVQQMDLILSPSLLDWDHYPTSTTVPIPVDVPWTLRKTAKTFVHNAGNGGLDGRNGTAELLEAMKYVKSPIKLIIRTQSLDISTDDPRVTIEGHVSRETLFSVGDVFIFPEKFNGLSLPLQEAYASGMLVMATDRYPINTWLPKEPLIRTRGEIETRVYRTVQKAIIDPKDIAAMIDAWYGQDITEYSRMGKRWADMHSWDNLRDLYLNACKI